MAKTCVKDISYSPEIFRFCSWRLVAHLYLSCYHRCTYCYAKYTFRDKIVARINCPDLLGKEIRKFKRITPVNIGSITDPYQPIEKEKKLTRRFLEACLKYKVPVLVVTKSSLVKRDIDVLSELAKYNLVAVLITITTNDDKVREIIEPRASPIEERYEAIEELYRNKIPVSLRFDSLMIGINDKEEVIEGILENVGKYIKQVNTSTIEITPRVWKDFKPALEKINPEIIKEYKKYYFEEGWKDLRGIYRLNRKIAYEKLKMVSEIVKSKGVEFFTCKEGFFDLDSIGRCCHGYLNAYYYPTVYDIWQFVRKRKEVEWIEVEEFLKKEFKIFGKKILRFREMFKKGELFEGVVGIRVEGERIYFEEEKP